MKACILFFLLACFIVPARTQPAAPAPAAALAEPSVEQRLADLESYVNNRPRATDGQAISKISGPGPGHSAWVMTSAALVLFMTLPGLALFYGGLVRRKNVLSVLAQCLALTGIVGLLWWAVGYSLSFAPGGAFLGGLDHIFLRDVGVAPNPNYSPWVSHSLFAVYQMMFAIITPALTIGAIAERMKFKAVILFSALWMFVVYFPVAHMVWGVGGWMNGLGNAASAIKSIDFAGGIVVHMTSGWSALALCILLGKRRGHGREPMPPHSMVLCMVGTGMLWAGWYGFNAGSAVGIGLAAGAATFFACNVLKRKFGYDDSLDTFGVHAVGGTLGTILAGVFATTAANPNLGAPHLAGLVGQTLWLEQVKAGALVLGWSVAGTLVLAKITGWACGGLRVDEEDEVAGLDVTEHGEEGYILE